MKTNRYPLIIVFFINFLSCEKLIVSDQENNYLDDFEMSWEIIDRNYPLLEYKKIDWDHIYTLYQSRVNDARGDEFLKVLFDLLAELKDAHAGIIFRNGCYVQSYICPRATRDLYAYSPSVVRNYFNKELRLAGDQKIEYEIIEGNIGYIYISTFEGGNWIYEIDQVLNDLKDTKGLIIDVRNNNGGTWYSSDVVISRFLDSPLEHCPHYKHGEELEWPVLEPQGPFQYKNPVVILINGRTLSTAETFTEQMKQISSVTAIGDNTGGAGCSPERFALPSGLEIDVPTLEERRYDGVPMEWNGIPPDILVRQTKENIDKGIDRQLEYAINVLKYNR